MEQSEPVMDRVRFVKGWDQIREAGCLDVGDDIVLFLRSWILARAFSEDGDPT